VELFQEPLRTLTGKQELEFSDCVELVASMPDSHSNAHWRSQYATLHDAEHRRIPDFVAELENLERDWPIIAEKTGLQGPLGHRNKQNSGNARNYRQWYSDSTRDMIARRYAEDIETFRYEF
jgi:hypothetical protein